MLSVTDLSDTSLVIGPIETKRGVSLPASMIGDNDVEATRSWLREFESSPATLRSYRKEAERFLRWSASVCQKSLAHLNRADLDAYRAFMSNPPADWCGSRQGEYGTASWRPFDGPLSVGSQGYALSVLACLFNYLMQGQYLHANPFSLIRRKGVKRANDPTKTIRKPVMLAFLEFLDHKAAEEPAPENRLKFERELFVVSWLYWTGCRREELACARHKDLSISHSMTTDATRWTIFGKGQTQTWIPVRAAACIALSRYVAHHKEPSQPDLPILLPLRGPIRRLGNDQIWDIVKNAARRFSIQRPEFAKVFSRVSPHWMRHAITSHLLDEGTDPRYVQRLLRHESITTTMLYDSTDDRRFESEFRS